MRAMARTSSSGVIAASPLARASVSRLSKLRTRSWGCVQEKDSAFGPCLLCIVCSHTNTNS